MIPEKKSLESRIHHFRLKEQFNARDLFVSEMNNIYYLWKIRFLWKKLIEYVSHPEKLKWKISVILKRIHGEKISSAQPFPDTFINAYKNKLLKYIFLLNKKRNRSDDIENIQKIIDAYTGKPIIVYPQTVYWEPLQRPQQLLREMGKNGYLCFFCEPEESILNIRQVSENVYTVSGEKYLIYPLKKTNCIILCTWMLNLPFVSMLQNKKIWYDLIDRLELFSLYDDDMLELHDQVAMGADIVTYSGLELKKLLASRNDAIYLPNGVVCEDFDLSNLEDNFRKEKAESYFNSIKKPIIGFYGSIAEWLDYELIRKMAELRPDWNFVFIGKIWTNIGKIKGVPNIHLIDVVPYQDLPFYAINFDVAIIPFLINEITNSVSPIKLFEYTALGKPVVATPFFEITQYQDEPFVRLGNTAEEFIEKIEELLRMSPESINTKAVKFAQKNHWRERINIIEQKLIE